MVLTHTCESAGLLKNIKVNGQTRAAKLSGILFTWWHVALVNWTFQLTDGCVCFCPSLTPFSPPPKSSTYEVCFTFSLSSFSQPLAFISPIDWFLFPSWGWPVLFFFPLSFFFYPDVCLFFLYLESSKFGFYWLTYPIRLFIVLLEACAVLAFHTTTGRFAFEPALAVLDTFMLLDVHARCYTGRRRVLVAPLSAAKVVLYIVSIPVFYCIIPGNRWF